MASTLSRSKRMLELKRTEGSFLRTTDFMMILEGKRVSKKNTS